MYSITPVPDTDGKSDLETVFIELMPNASHQHPNRENSEWFGLAACA